MSEPLSFRELVPGDCHKIIVEGGQGTCIILDVRTAAEYAAGHIPGSMNLDFFSPAFRENISKLGSDKRYIVYCKMGTRGFRTMNLMQELGFSNVTNIRGGISAWTDAGLPVEK